MQQQKLADRFFLFGFFKGHSLSTTDERCRSSLVMPMPSSALMQRAVISLWWSQLKNTCSTHMSVYGNIWHTNSRDRWANGIQHAGCLEMGWQWWKHGQIRAGMSHKQLPWQQLPCVSLWVWAETWDTPPETPSNRQESQSWCCHNHTNQKAEQTSTTSVKKGVRVIHRVHNTPTSRW